MLHYASSGELAAQAARSERRLACRAAEAIERSSWRWPPEPSRPAGKQVTGVGYACYRTAKALERTVPLAFITQSLMICWYEVARELAAGTLTSDAQAARLRNTRFARRGALAGPRRISAGA